MSKDSLQSILEQRQRFLTFVRRRLADPARAEDILQAAYTRALQHGDSLEQADSAVHWFYRVLRNAVTDEYRRRGTEEKALEAWSRKLEETSVPTPEDHREMCGCLSGALATLKPAYAELLRAVDLDELPLREFAEAHNLTATNAGVRAHRARAALRKRLIAICGSCAEHGCLDCTCRS